MKADRAGAAWRSIPYLLAGLLASALLLLVYENRFGSFFYDSWAYYELSKTIFHDFYRFTTWRAYTSMSPYSSSFPPLWPTLIALWNALFAQGIYAGLWLATLVFLGFGVASEWAGRRIFGLSWVGLGAAALTLIDERLIDEVVGGKSIPLHLALLAVALGLLRDPERIGVRRAAVLGAVMGIALMNRFDALIPAGVIGVGILLATRRIEVFAAYGACGFALSLPWVAYSLSHHGTFFMSDNKAVASYVRNTQIVDFLPDGLPTLFDQPGAWLLKIWGNFLWFLRDGARPTPIIALLGVLAALALIYRRLQMRRWPNSMRAPALALAIMAVALTVQLASYIVTGYIDGRYFSAHRWLFEFAALGVLARALQPRFAFAPVGLLAIAVVAGVVGGWRHHPYVDPHETSAAIAEADAVRACLRGSRDPGVAFANSQLAAAFGAETGIRAAYLPGNWSALSSAERSLFLKRFAITHVHVHGDLPAPAAGVAMVRVEGCAAPLWAFAPRQSF